MIDISKALAASDYQCDERTAELTWLAEQASKHHNILEIGSWKGCTARAMADNVNHGFVTCVDTWDGGDNWQFREEIAQHNPDWAAQEFERNTYGLANIRALRMTSRDARRKLIGNHFDMIFIDAAHDYESVKEDIQLWYNVLVPGGLFCGHDKDWEGVAKAVKEFFPNAKVGAGAIWYAD